jgi:hypothetical protein
MLGRSRHLICVVLALSIITGCSKGSQGSNAPGAPGGGQPASTFPVYAPNTMVTAGKYDDSLEVTRFGSSFFGSGPTAAYPYVGTQELLTTSASLSDLEAWVKKLNQSPPPGFLPGQGLTDQEQGVATPAPGASGMQEPSGQFLSVVNSWGLVPYSFWNKEHNHVVMMFLLEPKALAGHMGPTLALIDEWNQVPPIVRSGIDATLKKQAGLSASDLMDPSTPMGMITYVARTYKDKDTRAIVLIDATRQPNPLPTPHNT